MGASYQILRAIRSDQIKIAVSVALVAEYQSVTLRPGIVPALTPVDIEILLDGLCNLAHQQNVFFTWRPMLPDADDDMVLELAVAAGARFIITHNIDDFRGSESFGIKAVTPAQALAAI